MKKSIKLFLMGTIVFSPTVWARKTRTLLSKPWDGNQYHSNSDRQSVAGQLLLDMMSPEDFRECDLIADFGCGTGKTLHVIAEKSPKASLIGFDLSQSMIEKAKAENKSKQISFEQADIQDLPNEYSASCDLIFSSATMHWVPDHEAVFYQVGRYLKPGGKVLMSANIKFDPNSYPLFKAFATINKQEKWVNHFKGFSDQFEGFNGIDLEKLEQYLAGNDLIIIKKAIFNEEAGNDAPATISFKDKQALIEWLKGWIIGFSAVEAMSQEDRNAYLIAIVDEYVDNLPPSSDGRIYHMMAPSIRLYAQKLLSKGAAHE